MFVSSNPADPIFYENWFSLFSLVFENKNNNNNNNNSNLYRAGFKKLAHRRFDVEMLGIVILAK